MALKTEKKEKDKESSSLQTPSPGRKVYFWFGFATGIAVLAVVGLAILVFSKGSFVSPGTSDLGFGGGNGGGEENAKQAGGQKQIGTVSLAQIAKLVGVDEKKFSSCFEKKETENIVNEDYQEGLEKGVRGTPGNFINGYSIPGAVPFEQVKEVIDQLLEGKKPADEQSTEFTITKEDRVRGDFNAPITIVEFSDFECPFCKMFHPTMRRVLEEYKGKVRWVYKHYPLDSIHPKARPVAIASECVYQQKGNEGFWKFADEVFEKQDQLSI